MKTYNKSLDYVVLAMEQYTKGKPKTAAALFAKAIKQTDVKAAIAILEHNNAQAYTAKVKAEASAKKPTKVKAAEEEAIDSLVGDLGELGDDDEEVEGEEEMETEAATEDEEPEAAEDEAIEEEDETPAAFARALASLTKEPAKKARK